MYTRFKVNIWAAYLAKMGSLSSKNCGVQYLLCVIDVFTKYFWIKSLNDKKVKTVLNGFFEIANESNANQINYGMIKEKIPNLIAKSNNKSYLGYLNELVDQYKNTYHRSIRKKSIHADYFVLTKEIEFSHKFPQFKIDDSVRITKCKNIFSKGYTKKWSREIFTIDSVLKTNLQTYKVKDLNNKQY